MSEPAHMFRARLGRKEYAKLDETWLELLESETGIGQLLELVELTERYAPEGKAELLLWILADTMKEANRDRDRLQALRRLVRLTREQAKLAAELADCYRQLYRNAPELERLLQKSGLGYGHPLKPALEAMVRYVQLLPGSWLYDHENGPCRVEQLDLLLDRVTLRCGRDTRLTLNSETCLRRLTPAQPDGYFSLLSENRKSLSALADKDPAEVVVLYLRDTGRQADVKELKAGLSGIVSPEAWEGFWNRARKRLEQHPNVLVRAKPARTFQWSDQPVGKPGPAGVSSVEHGKTPAAGMAPVMSDDDTLESYNALTSSAQRRRFIEQFRQAQPERWPALATPLFLSAKDRRIRTWLEAELSQSNPDSWHKLLVEVLTGYRQNPDAFLWLLENASRFGSQIIAGAVSRAVDLLESASFRKLWPRVRSALADERWQLLGLALAETELPAAKALLVRIRKLTLLAPYEKDEIIAVFASRFPELAQKPKDDVILSTAAGIERARQELAKLVQEEIPRSAEEIGRARAHGDLSENYEFKAAKEKQARLMQRVGKLRTDLARARPIAREYIDLSIVSVGCRVKLEDSTGALPEYAILGPWDSDPDHGIISYQAPLGQKLLGRKPGESVELDGRILTVKEITTALL